MLRWKAFDFRWGLPDVVGDIQHALLCCLVSNIARSSDSSPYEPDQFRILKENQKPIATDVDAMEGITEAQKYRLVFGS